MPPRRSAASITMRPLDDLFQPTVPQQADAQYLGTLQFHELHPFPNHPFQVRQDEELYKLADSIREHGLAEPILCRPEPNGDGYQIISGHRRAEACRLAGIADIPVSVQEMDDDLSILVMVDANLHREKILPSEKAYSYKMKVEALERRRASEPGLVVSEYRRPTEIVGEEAGENYRNVMRYIRLTHLEKPLLDLVDAGKIKLHPAVELSYLKKREQALLLSFLENTCMKAMPSLQQARQLKTISQGHGLAMEDFEDVLISRNVPEQSIFFKLNDLREFFPPSYTVEQIKDGILDALANRQRNRERER
ncbi:ParB/RepB/Spo0J family partition protein [Christensenellaceae bacterium OttesenSCG-928-M15]|nr:ParB/RepB/Spo0J family partition protein [Christensenellaceae bacterium OttesenSCG-928-M15]